MSMVQPRSADTEALKAEWLDHLGALVAQVRGWAEASGWRTRVTSKPVTEPGLARYEVPLLLMNRGALEVVLSPLARMAPAVDGVVDLYLMPAYDDIVRLVFEDGRWWLRNIIPGDPTATRSVIDGERVPLDEDALKRILDAVAAAA